MNYDTETPKQAPDYKQVRKYLRTIDQREALGNFVKAGWTPAELGEYARQMYLVPGKTKPTAASYQFVIEKGPEHLFAQEILAIMRAAGYTMPPFDRPEPKRFPWDDPDNPEHTTEIKNDVEQIAKLWRARDENRRRGGPQPISDDPIPRWLWKRCYRLRNRYHSLEDTLSIQGFSGNPEEHLEPADSPHGKPMLTEHTDIHAQLLGLSTGALRDPEESRGELWHTNQCERHTRSNRTHGLLCGITVASCCLVQLRTIIPPKTEDQLRSVGSPQEPRGAR